MTMVPPMRGLLHCWWIRPPRHHHWHSNHASNVVMPAHSACLLASAAVVDVVCGRAAPLPVPHWSPSALTAPRRHPAAVHSPPLLLRLHPCPQHPLLLPLVHHLHLPPPPPRTAPPQTWPCTTDTWDSAPSTTERYNSSERYAGRAGRGSAHRVRTRRGRWSTCCDQSRDLVFLVDGRRCSQSPLRGESSSGTSWRVESRCSCS
mmetsp:Transcript_30996/g.57376  ORF Transcript_30996/g.57376 Transcript_30996/m.57376 type:complete len:204 (-) Transcript_30996:1854-2465(-)